MMEDINVGVDASICKEILAVTCTVFRPLTLQELRAFIPPMHGFDLNDVAEIISECGSFLTLQGNTVLFMHQSAKDFLLKHSEAQIFPNAIIEQHRVLFTKSIELLNSILRRDIYRLERPGVCIDDITTPLPDPVAPVRYAALYWVAHLREARALCGKHMQDQGIIDQFIRQKYLFWVECLSLIRGIGLGMGAISVL